MFLDLWQENMNLMLTVNIKMEQCRLDLQESNK